MAHATAGALTHAGGAATLRPTICKETVFVRFPSADLALLTSFVFLAPSVLLMLNPWPAVAGGVAFQTGDVLAGVGTGRIKHFNSTGTLVDTLDTGTTCNEQSGMALTADATL